MTTKISIALIVICTSSIIAPVCLAESANLPVAKQKITYSQDIAPLINENCISCHRANGSAPFPLTSFDDVARRSTKILEALIDGRMPHGITARVTMIPPGTFQGPSRLTTEQIALFEGWMKSGQEPGDLLSVEGRKLPMAVPPLSHPDFVVNISKDGFEIPAGSKESPETKNIFRNFVIKSPFANDQFITAVQILPDGGPENKDQGMDRLIHHAHLFYDEEGKSPQLLANYKRNHPEDLADGFTGDEGLPKVVLGPWFPGGGPTIYPSGVGAKIKAGSYLVIQIHYALFNDAPYRDRSKVAIWLAHSPIVKERKSVIIKNEDFLIRAGDSQKVVEAEKKFDQDFSIYSMLPHMHQLGRDFLIEAILPSGDRKPLVDVEWDFNHQNQFVFRKPVSLPANTKIHLRGVYDNSSANPNQFNNPPKDIPWGESADREMLLAMLSYSFDKTTHSPIRPSISSLRLERAEQKHYRVLVAKGENIAPGAHFEANGKFALDSTYDAQDQSLRSARLAVQLSLRMRNHWSLPTIVVVNPDGARSEPLLLQRVQ